MIEKHESPFEALKRVDHRGEYWMGRELMVPTNYTNWQNFQRAINEARTAMTKRGYDVSEHFSLVPVKSGGRPGTDFRLSRMACRFVFMNGDPRKDGIAAAQQYFAEQTAFAERVQQETPALPGTYLDALKALVVEVEAKEKAELAAREAEMEAALLRPPAEAWNTLVDSEADYSVAEAAVILNRDPVIDTGRNRLFKWLMDNAVLYRTGDGQLVPYAQHLDLIRLKPQSRPDYAADDSRARKEAHSQVRVTPRGLSWIQQRMREETRPDLTEIGPVQGNVLRLHAR